MIGQTLGQRYRIIQQLGSGGFGETYLAEDLHMPVEPKLRCVVKWLRPQAIQPDVLRLFETEAKTLYNLGDNHDQIPKLFAYFEQDGDFFIIQEFIDGQDLGTEIIPGKILGEDYAIKLLQDVLEVLAYVHSNNVIHRDIKPENIMRRTLDDKLVLIDFGAVKQVSTNLLSAAEKTRITVGIGTPGYMPCEQAFGKPKLQSDIYALGMTIIYALTGIPPYKLLEDNDGEVQWQNNIQVSNTLAEILTKMVRFDWRQRYANATDALQALNGVLCILQLRKLEPMLLSDCKYGYVDNRMAIVVIPPQFDLAHEFSEGLAGVRIGDKYGYIDMSGRITIFPQFDRASQFHQGLASVLIGSKWGCINTSGEVIIPAKFSNSFNFYEGLASILIGKNWGYIDVNGELVISANFDFAMSFKNGLANVKINNKWGCIDTSGKFIVTPQFDDALEFYQGLAMVKIASKCGYINTNGKLAISPQYDSASVFHEGVAIVVKGKKYGLIDRDGKFIISPQFNHIGFFEEGLATVIRDSKWGYINLDGSLVISPQFDRASNFHEGLAPVEINGKYGYINKSGELVIAPQFDYAGEFDNGKAYVSIGKNKHYINTKGEIEETFF